MAVPSPAPANQQREIQRKETVRGSGASDQPSAKDDLGFQPYVNAIAAFLTHEDTRPPLTLSVEGEWGSGKSSFMLQLQDEIKRRLKAQKKKAKFVWFNSWRQDKDEELWAAFSHHCIRELSRQVGFVSRPCRHLLLQFRRFDFRRGWFDLAKFACLLALFIFASVQVLHYVRHDPNWRTALFLDKPSSKEGAQAKPSPKEVLDERLLRFLLGSSGLAGFFLVSLMFARRIGELVANPLQVDLEKFVADPKYDERLAFIDRFQEDFRRMLDCYAPGERVYIFVDDLDRCEVPKSADLVQALNKIISDSPQVIYILGLDRDKIAAGIAAKFQQLITILQDDGEQPKAPSKDFGFSYLEKFIQIPFQIPRPTGGDIARLLQSLNDKAPESADSQKDSVSPRILVETASDSTMVKGIVAMVAPAFDFNPRRVKQMINCFRVQAIIADQTGMFGTSRDPSRFDPLTPEQLGKLIAIYLGWPSLLRGLARDRKALLKMQKQALQSLRTDEFTGETSMQPKASNYSQWKLSALLCHGVTDIQACIAAIDKGNRTGDDWDTYRLDRVDLERYLQIAPAISRPAKTQAPENEFTSPVDIAQGDSQPEAQTRRESPVEAAASAERKPA